MTDVLIERIESGMTTIDDARTVSMIIARLDAYETCLRQISLYGTGEAAMNAARALAETHEPACCA